MRRPRIGCFMRRRSWHFLTGRCMDITQKMEAALHLSSSAKRLQWLTAHEERIAFFKKNGYEKLLPAAYRKLCDACITFYFRCTEQVKDAEELKKELRKRLETYRANGAAGSQRCL